MISRRVRHSVVPALMNERWAVDGVSKPLLRIIYRRRFSLVGSVVRPDDDLDKYGVLSMQTQLNVF